MQLRTILNNTFALALLCVWVGMLEAQEHPARRLSSIVGVAVEEYGKGVDARGRLISSQEYQEAVSFLTDARSAADRLSGNRASAVRAILDTLATAMAAKKPSVVVDSLHQRFTATLGTEGALELPTGPLSLASGGQLYKSECASCHGERGMGDGPMAREMNPPPPAIGDPAVTAEAKPALLYRIISVGVPGTSMPAWGAKLSAQQRWEVLSYVQSLHSTPADRLEGEGLFLQRCATCHGVTGALDGAATRALSKLPPEIGSFAWQVEHSDDAIAAVIRQGIPGSAMPPSRDLSAADVAKIVAYVRSLPQRRDATPAMAAAAPDTSAEQAARTVVVTLDQALAAAQAGRMSEAGDRAFDAYIAFEPL
jgi:mono/diheme cytochrome c family protein